ncbi:MAG: S1 family peptidase [Gemmatimonadetes bacterium]|nr:S1 family peptidase [Gemmatimonadota bacterium]
MRYRNLTLFFSLAAPLMLAACDRDDTPLGADAAQPSASGQPAQPRRLGIEARFAEIERQVPGFGGYFYDQSGNLSAYLVDMGHAPQARTALARVLAERPAQARGPSGSGEVKVLKGRYPFSQLARWHDQLTGVLGTPGVVYTDIDESRNVLRVGVENAGLERAVRAHAARSGVPGEAVEVTVTEPIKRVGHTLQDYNRPVEGGLQIALAAGTCTLGYSVNWGSYLTNSHCTDTQGGVEYTAHYQPSAPYYIGYEYADPYYWSGGSCPAGRRCRYSDSSLGAYDSGTWWHQGWVARTTYWGTTSPGSIIIDDYSPRLQVTGEQAYPTQGQWLDKIGKTTGWTYGQVTYTCVHTNVYLSDITQLCQDFVNAAVDEGDSGSPVFVWHGSTVTAAGLLWGGSGSTFVFSAISNIEWELGNLSFF